ncbi:uncharacterized protein K441DRAFT_45017 [Cenococcum geophilum 1.58]|uniref:uncharacterized protein n=1 Tax=Cenococcum geophilum 1.58 TaxID=794803 RepID=UPI00358E9873|nr:hypothetical protein K441DRAFT_45017 [Cenococcum geophilum 1.58]
MAQVLSFSLTSAVVTKLFCLSTFPGSFLKLIILAVRYRAARGRYLILRSISANVLTMRSKIWSVGSVSTPLYITVLYETVTLSLSILLPPNTWRNRSRYMLLNSALIDSSPYVCRVVMIVCSELKLQLCDCSE